MPAPPNALDRITMSRLHHYVLRSELAPVCIVHRSPDRRGFMCMAGPFDTYDEAYSWMCDNC